MSDKLLNVFQSNHLISQMMSQPTSHLIVVLLLFSTPDISHDVRPGQCGDEDLQPDWYDVAAMSLGWLPAIPGPNAAGLPL